MSTHTQAHPSEICAVLLRASLLKLVRTPVPDHTHQLAPEWRFADHGEEVVSVPADIARERRHTCPGCAYQFRSDQFAYGNA